MAFEIEHVHTFFDLNMKHVRELESFNKVDYYKNTNYEISLYKI